MFFYEYFRTWTGAKIIVELKNNSVFCGTFVAIDPFFNIKLENTTIINKNSPFENLALCTIRGSSIKLIKLRNSLKSAVPLADASRLRAFLEK